jgi:hypothetical protein
MARRSSSSCLAREVGHLEVVPRGLAGLPGERGGGVEALADQDPVGGLDRLPLRLPGRVLARPRERGDPQPLVAGFAVQHHVRQQPGLAFEHPDRAGNRRDRAEPGDLLPAAQPAMAFDGQVQQVIHGILRTGPGAVTRLGPR